MTKSVTHPDSNSCIAYNNKYAYTIKKDFYMINCKVDTLGIDLNDCDVCNKGSYCQPYVLGDPISYQFTSINYSSIYKIEVKDASGTIHATIYGAPYITQGSSEDKSVYTINVNVDMEAVITDFSEGNYSCFQLKFYAYDLFTEQEYTFNSAFYCEVICDEFTVAFDSLYPNKDCNGYTYTGVGGTTYNNFLRLKGQVYYNAYNFDVQISDRFKEITKKVEDSYIFESTKQLPEWVVKKFKAVVMGTDIIVRTYKGSTMLNEYTFVVKKGADMNNESGILWNLKQEFTQICEISNIC